MSVRECEEPVCLAAPDGNIRQVIEPKEKDLGGFSVRRVLPANDYKRVGPFIFFDHMGPSTFEPGNGVDVRPHPHIGLSTLTYLFDGAIMHRDSLGYVQAIEPGAVNWMTAGRGIVHSERTPDDIRASGHTLHGLQSWIALPDGQEEVEPSFTHIPSSALPVIDCNGYAMTLIAGSAFGKTSPVTTHSPLFYLHADVPAGASIPVPEDFAERALYVVDGEISVADQTFGAHHMVVLEGDGSVGVRAIGAASVMLLGGAPLESERIVWWNFSSSSGARLEAAKQDWVKGRFDGIEGETEFIPLPE
jgi:hypothetical protein